MSDERIVMDEVGRYWDAVAQGDGAPKPALDPELAETIRRVHGLASNPPAEARERVWQSVLANAETARRQEERSMLHLLTPNGRALNVPGIGIPERAPASRQPVFAAQVATAALLLLTLAGAFMVLGPGRVSRQEGPPVFIPAIEATTATPEASETTETPVAEFLWASEGGPDMPFGDPYFLAVGPDGNLWIPDGVNGRIQIFTPDGEFVEAWGTPGDGEGEFDFRDGGYGFGAIAFAPDGSFYVADMGNNRVQKFDLDRTFLMSWGGDGDGDGQFRAPLGIAVDGEGRVYVTDSDRSDVQIFDRDGAFLGKWGGFGSDEGQLRDPHAIAIDGDSNIWVADFSNGRIQQFSSDGTFLQSWNGAANGGKQFIQPANVVFDQQGRIYVVEWSGQRIQVFTPDGEFVASWEAYGSDPGDFRGPLGIAFDGNGRVFITEDGNDRVQAFRLLPPLGVVEAATAATPVADTGAVAEVVWETRGGPDLPLSYPGYLALDPEGNLWIPDSGNDRYQIFSPDGEFLEVWGESGSGDGQFEFELDLWHSSSIAFAPDGAFYVTDPGNFRVQKFGPDRAFLAAWGEEGTGPGQFKLVNGIAVDGEGRVYVTDDSRKDVQVFDADGRYLRSIGEMGFNDGQFMFSTGSDVTIDAAGNIVVSDSSAQRIQTFSPEGAFLSMLAGGPREDELGMPQQVAIDGEGRMYVATGDLRQVQVFATDGSYLGAIGRANPTAWAEGEVPSGEFLVPTGVVLDDQGNIYVADYEDYRVQKFRLLPPLARATLRPAEHTASPAAGAPPAAASPADLVWQTQGGPGRSFDDPANPAIDPAGNLWIADGRNHRFQIFSPDGEFLEAWGTAGRGDGQFDLELNGYGGGAVIWDANGNFYVADIGNHRIQTFAPDRTFVAAWGGEGMAEGQFMALNDLALDGQGRLLASDGGRHDIQMFDRDGRFLESWGGNGDDTVQFMAPTGIAIDGDGNLYVSEYGNNRVQKVSADGMPIAVWGAFGREEGQFINPVDVVVDAQGRVFVTELGNNRVQVFDTDGGFLVSWGGLANRRAPILANPNGATLDGEGFIYVSDDGNDSVFKFQLLSPLAPA